MNTDDQITQLLKKMKPWIHRVANGYTTDPGTAADLFQEGWIAAWQAIEKSTGENVESYAKYAVTWRMLSVLKGDTFGSHKKSHSSKTVLVPVSLYHEDTNDKLSTVWNDLTTDGGIDELSRHYDEIHDAVGSLTDRQAEYIRLRFWEHMDTPELTKHFGYEPWGLWRSARKKLVPTLVHLKGAV